MPDDPAPPDPPAAAPAPPRAPTPPASGGEACGWLSDLPAFYGAQPRVVRLRLETFVRDAGAEQVRAWDESIPWLQRECRELVDAYDAARAWTAILEYELPRESRRPDVIVLENGVVVVLELKGKAVPSQDSVRICEDINRIVSRQGRFTPANVTLTAEQRNHILRLKARMIADGAWQTRQ
jgi:hypothetical protein